MIIFNHFKHINLTSDQQNAVERIDAFLKSDEKVFILQGYAGSGKTTLLKGIIDFLDAERKLHQLMAPTGRAAKVINQKTGYPGSTIHRAIYNFDELKEIKEGEDESNISYLYQYKLYENPDAKNSILIVDEASMLSDVYNEGEFFRFGTGQLMYDLMSYGSIQNPDAKSKVIFIGDPAQLPPIGMNFSPALSQDYLLEKYGLKSSIVEMKEVKRQDANNAILDSATKIRQCLTSGHFNDFDLRENKRDIVNIQIQDFVETYNN